MTIPVPQVKYNLLIEGNPRAPAPAPPRRCWTVSLILVLFIPVTLLLGLHLYTLYNNTNVEKEALTRAQLYSIDEYLHNKFVGKKNIGNVNTEYISVQSIRPKLICYYAYPSSWNDSTLLLPEGIDCNLCTHINIAFATIKNHTILLSDNLSASIPRVVDLKKCNKDLKVLLSIGGGGSDNGFPDMVTTHATRKEFIVSIKNLFRQYALDGIDLDWEFPGIRTIVTSKSRNISETIHKKERQHFSQLLHEIRSEYIREKKDYLLTVAVASPEFIVDSAYDVGELNQYVDFVNVMTYDFHYYTTYTPFTGFNSPLYKMKGDTLYLSSLNINYTAHMWVNKGMDRNKVIIGLPTYGHTFTLMNPENADPGSPAKGFGKVGNLGFTSYVEVCKFIQENSDVNIQFINETMSPYLHKGLEWISYEDARSISAKGSFIRDNKFGGAMVYSLNADDFSGSCSLGGGNKFYLTRKLNNIVLDNDL